jgi:hypothetical protein
MQRPTESSTSATRRGDEGEHYRRHHRDLERAVARVVHGSRELIEDACQTAWTIMLRSEPDRTAIFAWLRVVVLRTFVRPPRQAAWNAWAGGAIAPRTTSQLGESWLSV